MLARIDIRDSNYLIMLCMHSDHNILNLVHRPIRSWSEAWPEFQTTELVLAEFLKSSNSTVLDP